MMLIVLNRKSVKEINLPAGSDCGCAPNIRFIHKWLFRFRILFRNDKCWMWRSKLSHFYYIVSVMWLPLNLIWFFFSLAVVVMTMGEHWASMIKIANKFRVWTVLWLLFQILIKTTKQYQFVWMLPRANKRRYIGLGTTDILSKQ